MSDTQVFKIEVNQEDAKEALLKSLIKSEIPQVLEKYLNAAWGSYETKSQVEKMVGSIFATSFKEIIESKYKETIKKKVEILLTEKVVQDVCDRLANQLLNTLRGDR